MAPVEINEVFGRADGGISARPFRCRGEDGRLYYVKLGNALPRSLCAEWLGGNLARAMGLPVPDFAHVRVSRELLYTLPAEFSELGHGIGFGSVAAPRGARDLLYRDLQIIRDQALMARIIAFDAWILNEDRFLSQAGGNPNMLFVPPHPDSILLIDHDSAFDDNFDAGNFRSGHLSRHAINYWSNGILREEWLKLAGVACERISLWWEQIPEEWLSQEGRDPKVWLELPEVMTVLEKPFRRPDEFWDILTP